jgi:hypothetical protein
MLNIPVPTNFAESTFLMMGVFFGRAFGKQLDQGIQDTEWFGKRSKMVQEIVSRLLDFLHHWWIGALLMIIFQNSQVISFQILSLPPFDFNLFWFGAGLFIDDLPDIPPRIRDILKGYAGWWSGNNQSNQITEVNKT